MEPHGTVGCALLVCSPQADRLHIAGSILLDHVRATTCVVNPGFFQTLVPTGVPFCNCQHPLHVMLLLSKWG